MRRDWGSGVAAAERLAATRLPLPQPDGSHSVARAQRRPAAPLPRSRRITVLRANAAAPPLDSRPACAGSDFFGVDEGHHAAQLASYLLDGMVDVALAHRIEFRTARAVLID